MVRVRVLVGRQGSRACGCCASSSGASALWLLLLLRRGTRVRLVQVGLRGEQRVQVNVHDAQALVPERHHGGTGPAPVRLLRRLLKVLLFVHDADQ
jgi:hypothetical protein